MASTHAAEHIPAKQVPYTSCQRPEHWGAKHLHHWTLSFLHPTSGTRKDITARRFSAVLASWQQNLAQRSTQEKLPDPQGSEWLQQGVFHHWEGHLCKAEDSTDTDYSVLSPGSSITWFGNLAHSHNICRKDLCGPSAVCQGKTRSSSFFLFHFAFKKKKKNPVKKYSLRCKDACTLYCLGHPLAHVTRRFLGESGSNGSRTPCLSTRMSTVPIQPGESSLSVPVTNL